MSGKSIGNLYSAMERRSRGDQVTNVIASRSAYHANGVQSL